jgi:DNA-binding response OmpR family regulator
MLILVVEDDERVAQFLRKGLREEGYQVDVVDRGDLAREQALAQPYDLVLLDWSLPGADGVALLRQWRQAGLSAPVIMLTARTGVDSTVLALDAGADDYIAKPFRFEELLARVRAHHRRSQADGARQLVQIGAATVDLRRRVVTRGGEAVELSGREFALLELLLKHRGEPVSRGRILDRVWGASQDPLTNVVEVYIRYLRAKLGDEAIETLRGRGYRLLRQEEFPGEAGR